MLDSLTLLQHVLLICILGDPFPTGVPSPSPRALFCCSCMEASILICINLQTCEMTATICMLPGQLYIYQESVQSLWLDGVSGVKHIAAEPYALPVAA